MPVSTNAAGPDRTVLSATQSSTCRRLGELTALRLVVEMDP
jgi:hypothetical protein